MLKKALAISIVIPAYNEEDHLEACLDCIAAQSVVPDEVIVVDNNSTDATAAIARRYPFVRLVKEPKQGKEYARNAGFNAARGRIIGRIDADTHLPKNWVKRVLAFYDLPANAELALTGGCAFYNVRLPKVNQWITSQFVFRLNRWLVGYYLLWGSNMALPGGLWKEVKNDVCLRADIHEDLDLAIHLHRKGYGIHYRANLVVGAQIRRVFKNHRLLWANLRMWPRTLRTHGIKSWPISFLGAVFLFVTQPVPWAAEGVARLFGYKPLN
jgi:glycosyltransferase involved in cell wall biosynthesis